MTALRSLTRASLDDAGPSEDTMLQALELGAGFRALFNLPESVAAVRNLAASDAAEDVYWRGVLDYCVAGNLQAVLDEYMHVLADWVEDRAPEKGGKSAAMIDAAMDAIGIRSADLTVRTFASDGSVSEPLRMRSRFALRFGDGRSEDDGAIQRVDAVRKAFNSPFWPFVLATTSVGQEGLDFHLYSHSVVHWNLPSNPVDLEQREGRVHRFKGHAVRRNLAARYRADAFRDLASDPWQAMFASAPAADAGLQPFWVFEGDAKIERHVLAMPFSRDEAKLEELVRLLGIYRLAFGQPRQDELLAALAHVPDIESVVEDLLINLRPGSALRR